MRRLIGLLFLLLCLPIQAQETTTEYRWQAGDLILQYPTTWDSPLAESNADGLVEQLFIAEDDVENLQDRLETIPFIDLVWLKEATVDTDLYGQLDLALREVAIPAIGPVPSEVLAIPAIETSGISQDQQFIGYGRAVYFGDGEGALLIYGRASVEDSERFTTIFNDLIASLVKGANRVTNVASYGVQWYLQSTAVDGISGFLNLAGLDFDETTQRVVAVDPAVGVIIVDSAIGQVIRQISLRGDFVPTAIVTYAGQQYVADSACRCIRIVNGESEIDRIEGFSEGSPTALAISSDGTLYATDMRDNRAVIRAITANTDQSLSFEDLISEPPLIAVDSSDRLIALVEGRLFYRLDSVGFSPFIELQTDPLQATAFVIDDQNNLIVGTSNQGIFILDAEGNEINRIGRIVTAYPLAGEVVHPRGVAIGDNNTVFYADSDGTFGSITAVSPNVEAGRVGLNQLQNGSSVQGNVDTRIAQQEWSFMGEEDQLVSLLALANPEAPTLDLALRLLDDTGREVAFVDNDETGTLLNPFNAQLREYSLPKTGQYVVVVEAVSGEGNYQLGLAISQLISLETGRVDLQGTLNESLPYELWQFEGRAGAIITLTMFADEGSLDPLIRLLGRDGGMLIENDDAENGELGINAQIVNFRLPNNGTYTIVASRFGGEGRYILQVLLDE